MKKTILLLCFITFACSLFSQQTLSWNKSTKGVSAETKKDEAEVRIYSSLPLTFLSITKVKDNKAGVYKVEKEGPFNVTIFMFSSLHAYSDRKLRISISGYKSIEIPLQLAAYTITEISVWDKIPPVDEAKRLFEEGKYPQAKIKYIDALEGLDAMNQEDEVTIISQLDKVDECIIAKESADKLYNEKKWIEAKKEYEHVTAVNPADRFCLERITTCMKEYENSPRIIKGIVTDSSGKALAGVNIAPLENGKKGLRTVSDASGAYQVKTINKTTELVYWNNSASKETILTITGDIMNFVAIEKSIF